MRNSASPLRGERIKGLALVHSVTLTRPLSLSDGEAMRHVSGSGKRTLHSAVPSGYFGTLR